MALDDRAPRAFVTCVVSQSGSPDRFFSGALLAEVDSSPEPRSAEFSGTPGRSEDLRIYLVEDGGYAVERVAFSRSQSDDTEYASAICQTLDEVVAFFGSGPLACRLYALAGLDPTP